MITDKIANSFKAIPMPGFSGGYVEKAFLAIVGPISLSLLICSHFVCQTILNQTHETDGKAFKKETKICREEKRIVV